MTARAASLALLGLAACAGSPRPKTVFDATSPAGAAKASNDFSFDLFEAVGPGESNLISSPFSAAAALSMAAAGARGATRDEMLRTLHVDPAQVDKAHASFGQLLATLNSRDSQGNVELRVADRLWGKRGYTFQPAFLDLVRDDYGAALEAVDFERTAEAAEQINAWIAQQTRDRIPHLVSPDALGPQVRLVLTNAVYFKGAWSKPFRLTETSRRPFATPDGARPAPIMAQTSDFAYLQDGDVQIVELPYRGGLSMVVVLPPEGRSLRKVLALLARNYDRWMASLHGQEVDLWLPRWTTRSTLPLNGPLESLGLRLAFSTSADFSGMASEPLQIDSVLQQAFVQVDEVGTEAAAATAIMMVAVSLEEKPPPQVFHADHPFIYLLRDQATGAILFVGQVVDPG
ncbi:MAG TPA: serpin family protein [Polyangia bacterium]|nr:serpin family protein [Polyangia bacterium]